MGKIIAGFSFFAFLFVASIIGGSFYTVDEGEKAVVLRNGAVAGVSSPGFHWKAPFIDEAKTVSLRDGMLTFDEIQVYTADGQTATVHKVSISYRPKSSDTDVLQVYSRYGNVEQAVSQMVTRRVSETLEVVFGQFTADTAIKKRAELGLAFSKQIKNIEGPVEIIAAQIENFSLPDSYEANIEAKMSQEVEVLKLQQKLEQAKVNADISETNANAEALKRTIEAQAEADATRLAGEAVADAIRAKNEAIKESPNLVELTKAERWDGKLPTHFVPGTAVPFLNIK